MTTLLDRVRPDRPANRSRRRAGLLAGALAPRQAPGLPARALLNLRTGRIQRSLALGTAFAALPLGLEIYFEHFKGSFGDKWEWTPIVLSPLLSAAGVAGFVSERAAKTWLPALSALYCLDGAIGTFTHVRGVARKPGGFDEPLYNLVMGPPLLAPGSLFLVGGMGIVAALVRREP